MGVVPRLWEIIHTIHYDIYLTEQKYVIYCDVILWHLITSATIRVTKTALSKIREIMVANTVRAAVVRSKLPCTTVEVSLELTLP